VATLAVIDIEEVLILIDIRNDGVLSDEPLAILEVLFAALTEHTVRHEVSIGVVLVNWLIVPCPLALIGIPAETVESLALKLRLPQTSFGYACLVSGWRASSRTG